MLSNFQSPGDIAFSVLGFPVYYYGIILAIAIFVGYYTAYKLYDKFYDTQSSQNIVDFSPYLIIFGILGARIYYCLVNFSYYQNHILDIFNIRQGGLSIHGMLIGGVITLYVCSRIYKMSFRKLADVFLIGSLLAQSIGRWGNFFNSEAFGAPTNMPWGLYIPISHRPLEYLANEYFHPAFLYESILNLVIFIILFVLFKRISRIPGMAACLYLVLYSIIRIIVEYFRIDSVLYVCGLPVAQVVSVAMMLCGMLLICILLKKTN